jgi:hypothetical protein
MWRLAAALLVLAGLPLRSAAADQCKCGCCEVSKRTPAMQMNNLKFMCSPHPVQVSDSAEECPEQCRPEGGQVTFADLVGVVAYNRYCLSACWPNREQIGWTCSDVDATMAAKMVKNDFEDPAMTWTPDVVKIPEELAATAPEPEADQSQEADEADMQKALSNLGNGDGGNGGGPDPNAGLMVAKAAGKRAQAAAMDARAAKAEALSMAVVQNSSRALKGSFLRAKATTNAKAQLAAAAVRAAMYAKAAEASVKLAEKEVNEMLAVPDEAAAIAVKEALKVLKAKTRRWKYEEGETQKRIVPPKPALGLPATEVGQKYAAPYWAAMQNAMASRTAFEAKARGENDQAHALQESATQLAAQAAALQSAGMLGHAQTAMKRARGMLAEAKSVQEAADNDFIVAQRINTGLPGYQAGAELATAFGSEKSRKLWMPPPIPAASGASPAPAAA